VLLVIGRDVVTMDSRREIIRDGAVAIDGSTIVQPLRHTLLRARVPASSMCGAPETRASVRKRMISRW